MDTIARALRRDPASWLARVVSVCVSVWITLPIWNGGWLVHGDHAPHIQELLDLATHSSGWSDVAFAGFPLGALHSPLFFGLLAGLVRLGVPAWLAYTSFLTLTEIFLGLVAFELGRRRTTPGVALGAGVLVQTQSLLVSGPSGVLSGMATFGLAVAFFLLLADRLHARLEPRTYVQIAALVALIGLTHTFAIHAVVALVLVRTAGLLLAGKEERRAILGIGAACALGAVASAGYWLTAVLSIETSQMTPVVQSGWPNFQIFLRPFLERAFSPKVILTKGSAELPDLLLLTLSAFAFLRLYRLDRRTGSLVVTSSATMLFVLVVISHVATMSNREVFGPIPWRIMVVVRALLLFLVVGLFAHVRLSPRRSIALTLAISALSLGWAAQRAHLLQAPIPPRESLAYSDVDALFRELGRLAPSVRGRVYIQNTHGTAAVPLRDGHPLALAPARAGVRAVGSYYSLVPFATDRWLSSFAGPVVGERVSDSTRANIDRRLDDLDAELVVLTEPRSASILRRWQSRYEELAEIGPFTIFRRSSPGMATSQTPGTTVSSFRLEDGRITFDVTSPEREAAVDVAVSYARGWRVASALPRDSILPRESGLMQVYVPRGTHHVELVYEQPRWPSWLGLLGWALVLGWGWFAWRSPRAAETAPGATSPSAEPSLARSDSHA